MSTNLKIASLLLLLFLTALTGCDEDDEPIKPANGLVAKAGSDHSVLVNEDVQLDGSASHDKNGKPFSYLWTVKTKPAGSLPEISNTQISKPIFNADIAGDYIVQLQIIQGATSATDELTIHVQSNLATPIVLNDAILEDITFEDIFADASKADYIVTNDIDVKADLEIEPGVVIAFEQDKGMQVINGSIQARGSETQPIVFKGTGTGAGFWKGIAIYTNSELNTFEYVTIQQGGSDSYGEIGVAANIALAGTDYSGAALRLSHSESTLSAGYGLYVQGSSSIAGFSNNTFAHNDKAAAYVPAQQVHNLDDASHTANNGFNGVETGGHIQGINATWRKTLMGDYHVTSSILISGGLAMNPGVTMLMDEGTSIVVSDNGYLRAEGTSGDKIVFTSYALNKYWNGLAFNSASSNNILDQSIISNAGLSKFADADQPGNIVVGAAGVVSVKNSLIKNGHGYGIVAKSLASVNSDVLTVNNFENLSQGKTYPVLTNPDRPALTGTWVDQWTFNHGRADIDESLYDRENGKWFGGATDPHGAENAGYGLKIGDDGRFVWTAVEYFSVGECPSYMADFMTGNVATLPNSVLTFDLDYWRSMFSSYCDPTQNVDTGVETSPVTLHFEINELFNVITGERYWELKFFRPDNSTFSFYRK
ncbi:MAG TPA: hypothetical protein VFZ52_17475 [Chryseolinea sp.]